MSQQIAQCPWNAGHKNHSRCSSRREIQAFGVRIVNLADGGAPTAAKEVHEGTLFVQGNDEFKKQYDGRLEFRVRGNSSASHPKKSYKLKLDEKTKMFSLGVPVMFHKPEYLCTSARMMEWCTGFMQNYWDACTSATHLSGEGRHWSEYSDVDSMVNYWLVNELHGNLDAYQKSRYAYIDRGGKLMWGPVWDFDYASASVAIPTAQQPDVWFCSSDDWSKSENAWNTSSWRNFTKSCVYKEWASDPYFCMKAWERYWEIRGKYVELSADGGAVANAAARLKGALSVNDARWTRGRGHSEDTEIYRDFLRRRVAWLDEQFKDVPALMASLGTSGQTVPYVADGVAIEPTADGARRIVSAAVRSAVQVDVFVNGRLLGRYQVANGSIGEVPVPRRMLEREGCLNCVAFVAYGRLGAIVARNYCLFHTVPDRGTRIFIR